MKIRMKNDMINYTRQMVWLKGQEFDVEDDNKTYYKLVEMNGNMYGVNKDKVDELFEVIG